MTTAKGKKRNEERKLNYDNGNYGKRIRYTPIEKWMIRKHFACDRLLAKLLSSNVRGIQMMRWRMKKLNVKERIAISR